MAGSNRGPRRHQLDAGLVLPRRRAKTPLAAHGCPIFRCGPSCLPSHLFASRSSSPNNVAMRWLAFLPALAGLLATAAGDALEVDFDSDSTQVPQFVTVTDGSVGELCGQHGAKFNGGGVFEIVLPDPLPAGDYLTFSLTLGCPASATVTVNLQYTTDSGQTWKNVSPLKRGPSPVGVGAPRPLLLCSAIAHTTHVGCEAFPDLQSSSNGFLQRHLEDRQFQFALR